MRDQVLDRPRSILQRDLVAPPSRTSRRSRKRLALAGAALLTAAGAGWYGYDWWAVGRFIQSTDDAYVGGDITVIAPKVAGFIAEVAVSDNQPVHAGDLLLQAFSQRLLDCVRTADTAARQQADSIGISITPGPLARRDSASRTLASPAARSAAGAVMRPL